MDQLLAVVAAYYNLPALQYVSPVNDGFLSQNHILEADGQRLFLKRYRFTQRDGNPQARVARIHQAKTHFSEQGIPVILPLYGRADESFFVWGDSEEDERCFALFPFVNGVKTARGEMSQTTLQSAGEMLARLHCAGHNVFTIAPLKSKAAFDPDPFLQKTAHILALIEQKESRTTFDELAWESLNCKRSLAKRYPPNFHELGLNDDHLIHGDFHNDNFFVDEAGRVSHVFDWEQTKVTAREVEVLRSLLFMCLQRGDDFMIALSDDTFAQAAHYLQSYHEGYPLRAGMLAAAVENRFLGSIYSTWIEESHYLDNNSRVDLFLSGDLERLKYFSQNRKQFINQLCEML